jgi:TPR repeat protein
VRHFERQLCRATALILTATCTCVGQNISTAQIAADSAGREAQELFAAQRYPEAKDRATSGAAAGDATAMYVLGEIYSSGKGASKNYTESAGWMTKAANAGYAPAMNALGNLYETGMGVRSDYVQAAQWYQKGAEAGSAAAMTSLGLMYDNGRAATQAGQPGEPDFGEALTCRRIFHFIRRKPRSTTITFPSAAERLRCHRTPKPPLARGNPVVAYAS